MSDCAKAADIQLYPYLGHNESKFVDVTCSSSLIRVCYSVCVDVQLRVERETVVGGISILMSKYVFDLDPAVMVKKCLSRKNLQEGVVFRDKGSECRNIVDWLIL